MSLGNLTPPFRVPCDQNPSRPPAIAFGTEFQHNNQSDTASVFVNTTLVQHPTASGVMIPPYERPTFDDTGGLTCQQHFCTTASWQPCHAWERPYLHHLQQGLFPHRMRVQQAYYLERLQVHPLLLRQVRQSILFLLLN